MLFRSHGCGVAGADRTCHERTSELAVTKPNSPVSFALRNDTEDKERILRALKQANGNRKVAAELLGIGRTTLYSKLEEYGLKYKFQQP